MKNYKKLKLNNNIEKNKMTKDCDFTTLLPSKNNSTSNIVGIKLSNIAVQQIIFLTKNNNNTVRLSVKKTGCAGLKYFMEISKNNHNSDIYFKSKCIQIIINSQDLPILDGIEIDFVTEGVNKIFKFKNNKIKKFCGCGNSFNF